MARRAASSAAVQVRDQSARLLRLEFVVAVTTYRNWGSGNFSSEMSASLEPRSPLLLSVLDSEQRLSEPMRSAPDIAVVDAGVFEGNVGIKSRGFKIPLVKCRDGNAGSDFDPFI